MDRLLRAQEVTDAVGLSRQYLYVLIKQGKFPPPKKLNSRASAWLQSDIQDWIESRPTANLGPAPITCPSHKHEEVGAVCGSCEQYFEGSK